MKPRNMNLVADLIEKAAKPKSKATIGFNMGTYCGPSRYARDDRTGHNCETVACLAGWAYLAAGHKERELTRSSSSIIRHAAQKFLGLTANEASALFVPMNVALNTTTPEDAVATLRLSAVAKRIQWVHVL